MKMYSIPKGTKAILLENWEDSAIGTTPDGKHWITRKHLEFFNTVTDPIYFANNGRKIKNVLDSYAALGYAVFVDEDNPKYALATLYRNVEVVC